MIDDEKTLLDLHLKMYLEHHVQRRHVESQRGTIISGLTAISAAVIGLITYDHAITPYDLSLSILLIVIGLLGAAFSLKIWERSEGHKTRAIVQRDAMDRLLGSTSMRMLKEDADALHGQKMWRGLFYWGVNLLWALLPLTIVAVGGYLAAGALGWVKPPKSTTDSSSNAVASTVKPAEPKSAAVSTK